MSSGVENRPYLRKAFLESMINEELVYHYGGEIDKEKYPDYEIEKEWFRKQILLSFLKDREVYAKIDVTEKELRNAFVQLNQSIAARHLYAETEEEADNLYSLLQSGADFNELAKQVFTDSTLKNNGGYIGYFTLGDMDPNFEAAAYSMKPGEVSKPVKTSTGYSIIKVEDKKSNPLMTEYEFQTRKGKIANFLKIRKKGPNTNQFLNDILKEMSIQINDGNISKIFSYLTSFNPAGNESELEKIESPVVTTSSKEYNAEEVYEMLLSIPEFHRDNIKSEKNLKAVVKSLVLQQRLLEIAEEKGYHENPEVLESLDGMQTGLYIRYKTYQLKDNKEVSDSTLFAYYNKNIDMFTKPPAVELKEIVVESENEAGRIYNVLQNGGDFGKLAEENSIRSWSAKNGGSMGYVPVKELGVIRDRILDTKIGSYTAPIEFDGLYGIFMVTGKKEGEPIEFNNIKNEVSEMLKNEMQFDIFKAFVSNLKEEVSIKINEDLLNSSLNSKKAVD